MKHFFLVLLLALQSSLFANMAEPVIRGTLGSRPFTSKYVDILHEELNITIDSCFQTVDFEVIYTIRSAKSGSQIPLLFYAMGYLGDFQVAIDGNILHDITLPSSDFIDKDSLSFHFPKFKEESVLGSEAEGLSVNTSEQQMDLASFDNLIYFKTDISTGEHRIKVTYNATPWIDMWEEIKKYTLKYSLSPAEYWKSFGVLDVTIDATAFDKPIESNLGPLESGDINNIGHWSFEGSPVPVLEIYFNPKINDTAKFFLNLGGLNLALIIGFLLAVLHLIWIYFYRKKNLTVKYSKAVIIGSILVPLIFILTWIYSFDWFAYLIGPDASNVHGYRFMAIIGYPILVIPYWLIAWGFDKIDKRKLNKETI